LTTPFDDNRVYAYNQPHLYRLARVDDEYPRYAAVLTDTNTARIFVFGLGHVIDAEEVKGKKVHRVKVGGWSQARYQRRAGNAHQEHVKEVMEHLARIVREDHVSHIVLAGDSVAIPLLQAQLPKEMIHMVEAMKMDIHASDGDVLTATLAKLQEQEAATAAEKVDRLMNEYRARGLAVAGLHETLEALANGQVEELLVSGALDQSHPLPEKRGAATSIPARFAGDESRRKWKQFSPQRSPTRTEKPKTDRRHRNVHWGLGVARSGGWCGRVPAMARLGFARRGVVPAGTRSKDRLSLLRPPTAALVGETTAQAASTASSRVKSAPSPLIASPESRSQGDSSAGWSSNNCRVPWSPTNALPAI
jgi:hypothetical protein